jgi:predicted unusual protein kinase regulating ubiquinone biosynthesis (AarF/ABC1/UbiB family)
VQSDVLPEEVLAELGALQMAAPGMHPSLVRAQFRASLGRDPDAVFASFDATPFAAASLGQVHHAVTHDGEPVAVKIQYPGIAHAIESDFRCLRAVTLPARLARYVRPAVLDELHAQILAETDYRREARNIGYFRERLAHLPFVELPHVHEAYSTDVVLTMSRVEGMHLDVFLEDRPSQALRDRVGARLFELFYAQLLGVGAFHADPHWGNYLFRPDGTVGLVDFGCVKYVPDAFVTNLKQIFLYPGPRDSADFRTLLNQRYSLYGEAMSARARAALVRFADAFYGRVYPADPSNDDAPFDFSETAFLADYMRESMNVVRARGALPEYVFLARAESGLYQTLHRLGARVHTSRIVRAYLGGQARRGPAHA